MQCDVCKLEVPDGTRFCPKCGLEIVTARERAARPTPMEKDVFDWDEGPGKPKEYGVSQKQKPDMDAERVAELLQLAHTRLGEGQVLEAYALLKQVRPHLGRLAKFRALYEQMQKVIEARKESIRQRCDTFASVGDSDRIVGLLAGQAANEMDPEEICAVALKAARTLYDADRAEEAAEVLRVPPFRTVREEQLVREHRELELLAHRKRGRQHGLQSVMILGGVIVAAVVGLGMFARILWSGNFGASCWLLIPGLLVAVGLILYLPQIRGKLQKLIGKSSGSRTAEKLQVFLDRKRK
jgi:uncharacterized Zn finger protein (UPF0148 family)